MTLVSRPDLSRRTALSKSVLLQFDGCPTQVWYSIHDPRPFVPIEKVTFGSALDAAVEVIAGYLRTGATIQMVRAMEAARWIVERDEIEVDLEEVEHAAERFVTDVAPHHDWSLAVTQRRITGTLEGLGEVDGHPDILLPGEVWDVKATVSKSPKDPRSVELGFYVLLQEQIEGKHVDRVGYMEWRRGAPHGGLKVGKWETPSLEVTDEFRRWTTEKAAAYVRAKKADEVLNRKAANPGNYSMTGGPAYKGRCADCVYNPANGGPCQLAWREEIPA